MGLRVPRNCAQPHNGRSGGPVKLQKLDILKPVDPGIDTETSISKVRVCLTCDWRVKSLWSRDTTDRVAQPSHDNASENRSFVNVMSSLSIQQNTQESLVTCSEECITDI